MFEEENCNNLNRLIQNVVPFQSDCLISFFNIKFYELINYFFLYKENK